MVLGVFGESLWSGRRVALLGDTSTGLAELIAASAGRALHAYDPDRTRAATGLARSSRSGHGQVSYAVLDDSISDRAGAFDAVVVPDLAALGDTDARLDQLKELLSRRGFALIASPNPARSGPLASEPPVALDYYALYDALALRFERVRMLGQAPFAGYSVAEFAAEGAAGVTIDASLVSGSEEPDYFVAVASVQQLDVEPYTLVQVPWRQAREPVEGGDADATSAAEALDESARRCATLGEQLERLRERERAAREQATERQQAITKLSSRCGELEAELSRVRELQRTDRQKHAARLARLEAQVEVGTKRRAELESEHARALEEAEDGFQLDLDRMLDRIAELENETPVADQAAVEPQREDAAARLAQGHQFQIDELRKALDESRTEHAALAKRAGQVDALEAQLADLERTAVVPARTATTSVAPADEIEDTHAGEITALEGKLAERGRLVASLQAELRESERIGRELVREIESARHQTPALGRAAAANEAGAEPAAARADEPADRARLQTQVDTLLERCARHQADLQAAQWENTALRDQLEERGAPPADAPKLEQALAAARRQVAALRAQLAEQG